MKNHCRSMLLLAFTLAVPLARAEIQARVIDLPTRPGVTQRFLLLQPPNPVAAVILFSGGQGNLEIAPDGKIGRGGNFLVRSRERFVEQNLLVAVLDAPSDHQSAPYLKNFRQRPEHAADIQAVIAHLRQAHKLPVWLVGTSRGTQSVAYAATQLSKPQGPDGIVLTSTMLSDVPGGRAVPDLPLEKLAIPVLVVHHEQDGCKLCRFDLVPRLMRKLDKLPRRELLTFTGGNNVGDPCQAKAHHGFNGQEEEVISAVAKWIKANDQNLDKLK